MHHSLTIEDRGEGHIHRHKPSCACGWIGVPRRRRKEAEGQYKSHVNSTFKHKHRVPQPRKLTPVDKLPEELRQRNAS